MTVRTATAVVLALGLLAAGLPAIEDARTEHAADRVAAAVIDLDRVATALARENDVVRGVPARTRLTLHLPLRSWRSSGLEELRFASRVSDTDVEWAVRGGARHARELAGIDLVAPDGLTIESGGPQQLTLELRRIGRRRVVRVGHAHVPAEVDG